MWLAVSCHSKEKHFASSLWACIWGAENSSFVHEVQSTLWNQENNSYPISQVAKQKQGQLEKLKSQWKTFTLCLYMEKMTLWSLSLDWTAGEKIMCHCLVWEECLAVDSVMPSFFGNLPKRFTMRPLQTRGELLSCGVKSECTFCHFCWGNGKKGVCPPNEMPFFPV